MLIIYAGVAQPEERLICNQQVAGSSPPTSSSAFQRGEVPEWPKGADCKSAGAAFGGSNPPLSTIGRRWAGIAQLARASAFQAEGRGFESRFPLHRKDMVGRWRPEFWTVSPRSSGVERFLGKEEVIGSIPIVGSRNNAIFRRCKEVI